MLRSEPFEPTTALHEIQQQLITLNEENKQQWYGRVQEPPLVPPTWLGFPDPAPEPEEPPCCRDYPCVNAFVPDIDGIYSEDTLHGGWYRLEAVSPDLCLWEYVNPIGNGGTLANANTIKGITFFQNERYSSPETMQWVLVVTYYGADGHSPGGTVVWRFGPTLDCEGVNTKDGGHVVHCWCPVDLTRPKAGTASVELVADCSDPPPTNTGTSSGTGSGTSPGPDCGSEAPMYVWGSYYPGMSAWFPLTYPCINGCVGRIPGRPGEYEGEVAAGTCEPP